MQNLCYRDIKAPNIIPKVEFTTRSFIPTRILQDNMKKFVKGEGASQLVLYVRFFVEVDLDNEKEMEM